MNTETVDIPWLEKLEDNDSDTDQIERIDFITLLQEQYYH